jgi:hypothetical protein
MYILAASSSTALPKPSSWRQRRPDLTLVNSSQWSYSANCLERPYPSPPMSNSPTSPRRSSHFAEERSAGNLNGQSTSAPGGHNIHSSQSVSMEGPLQAMPAPVQQHQHQHHQSRFVQHPGMYQDQQHDIQPRPIASNPSYGHQYQGGYAPISQPSAAPLHGVPVSRAQLPQNTYHGPVSMAGAANPRITRTSRRAKAHVARACQNCKKAHLSCDEARPCARCVGSGKQVYHSALCPVP